VAVAEAVVVGAMAMGAADAVGVTEAAVALPRQIGTSGDTVANRSCVDFVRHLGHLVGVWIQTALKKRKRTGEGVRGIAKRFGVDPSTVQRISRPFADVAAPA
jgi:cyanophycinase-like exopeptidase